LGVFKIISGCSSGRGDRVLSRLIVDVYVWIIEIFLWLALLISSVVGYQYTVPMLQHAGAILEYQTAWKIVGAFVFALAAFLLSAVLAGPLLLLVDIRRSVATLVARSSGNGNRDLSAEQPEHFL
jgi:hypothetical protein